MTLHFFYDGEIDDLLFDLASTVSAEIELGPDFHSSYEMNSDLAISLKCPEKIPIQGDLVYLRNEPNWEQYIGEEKGFVMNKKHPFSTLRLHIQRALLGKVKPNLRAVGIDFSADEKKVFFYLTYHGEISDGDRDLSLSMIREAIVAFPGYDIDQSIKRVDFPAPERPTIDTNSPGLIRKLASSRAVIGMRNASPGTSTCARE